MIRRSSAPGLPAHEVEWTGGRTELSDSEFKSEPVRGSGWGPRKGPGKGQHFGALTGESAVAQAVGGAS